MISEELLQRLKENDTDAMVEIGDLYHRGEGVPQSYEVALTYYQKASAQDNSNALYRESDYFLNGYGVKEDIGKAVELRERAAELGHWGAQYKTGLYYENGFGVDKDIKKAIHWYELSAEQGLPYACYRLGLIYKNGNNEINCDYQRAMKYFVQAHEGEVLDASFQLGLMYETGTGTEVDLKKAHELYQYLCNAEYAPALSRMGVIYCEGIGVEKNIDKAIEYCEKAMELGDKQAEYILTHIYEKVLNDPKKTLEFYLKRAEEGSAQAQLELFFAYNYGNGVEKNEEIADMWCQKSADNGNPMAQTLTAFKLRKGGQVEKAVEYLEKASNTGYFEAIRDLADIYFKGEGNIPIQKKRALELYSNAADKGDVDSQRTLGVIYADGNGVEKNPAIAVTWFEKAADQGDIKSMAYLGILYMDDDNGVTNYQKAEFYLKKVRESDDKSLYANATYYLAALYSSKYKEYAKAFPFWLELAKMGDDESQLNVGLSYVHGWGVVPNLDSAILWLQKSANQNNYDAQRNLDLVIEAKRIENSQGSNGNQSNPTSNSSEGCYVATAVYGSYDCPEVWTLRRYRDYKLAENWYGRLFIRIYYAVSPTVVKWFGKTAWFNHFWREKLDYMVENLQEKGFASSPYEDKKF